jgi:hypothetical protein
MSRIVTLDTGESLFVSHQDPSHGQHDRWETPQLSCTRPRRDQP